MMPTLHLLRQCFHEEREAQLAEYNKLNVDHRSVDHILERAVMFDFANSGVKGIVQEQVQFTASLLAQDLFVLPYNIVAVRWGHQRMVIVGRNSDDFTLDARDAPLSGQPGTLFAMTTSPISDNPGDGRPPVGYVPCALIGEIHFTMPDNTIETLNINSRLFARLMPHMPLSDEEEIQAALGEVYCALQLLGLLYRRGATTRTTVGVKDSLNAKRARAGKPPIRPHHVVKLAMAGLTEDVGPGAGIGHASPIPHWRRAHPRHLRNGKVVKIDEMMVNFDGDDVMKPVYAAIRAKLRSTKGKAA